MANNILTQKALEFGTPELVGLITNNLIESMVALESKVSNNAAWVEFYNNNFYGLTTEQVLAKLT